MRAESLWEFHATERVVEAGFAQDGRARVIDALGTYSALDASGAAVLSRRLDKEVKAAALRPSGSAAVLTSAGSLVLLDQEGKTRSDTRSDANAVGASARFIALAGERQPVRLLSGDGRLLHEAAIEHPVAFVAPCSREGHVVALSGSGQFSVFHEDRLLWRLHLRTAACGLAASDEGTFVIAHRDGAQAFTLEGLCLGIFHGGEPVTGVSLSADAGKLLLLDETDVVHLVDVRTGWSTWREKRGRRQDFVRLSPDGSRALSISSAGAVEGIALVTSETRAERLEVLGRHAVPGSATWRPVLTIADGVVPACRFAVHPGGTSLALSPEPGAAIELRDMAGRIHATTPGAADLVGLAYSSDGERLVQHRMRSVVVVSRDGRPQAEIRVEAAHVAPGPRERLVIVTSAREPALLLHDGGRLLWRAPLAAPATALLASPDLALVAVADDGGDLSCWVSGGSHAWRRPHVARTGSVALGGPGLVACEDDDVVGLRPDGAVAWRKSLGARVELLTVAGNVFARDATNRFWWLGEDGEARAVDRGRNLGHSLLVRAPTGDAAGWLELNVNGRVLTAFTLAGNVAWRAEAPGTVAPADVVARGAAVVFRAGARICLVALADPEAGTDAATRAAFLEF